VQCEWSIHYRQVKMLIRGSACIVAVIRLHSLWAYSSVSIQQRPGEYLSQPEPITTNALQAKGVDIAIWSGLECNIAIMCACVPSLKPLFSRAFPSFLASLQSSKSDRINSVQPPDCSPPQPQHPLQGVDQGITVEQSFEMRTTAASDDNMSEKNLVTVNTSQYRTKSMTHAN
jgi:hypothetical protein